MQSPNSTKTWHTSFEPDSSAKMPASYQLYASPSRSFPGLYVATVVALNTDCPVPDDGKQGFWHSHDLTSLDSLSASVEEELVALNRGKQIYRSEARWLESP